MELARNRLWERLKLMKKLLATLCLLPAGVLVAIVFAFAQSAPNWPTGYNPTTAEINAAFAQKLDATNGTFTGAVNATTLNVSGLSSMAGSLNVTGNEAIAGTLTVGGPITFTNLAVAGSATFASTVAISGPATLASATVTGNETVGGTLGVTGASTLASLGVTNNQTVGGTLGVTGQLNANGLLAPSSTIGIKGTATNDNAQAGSVGEYIKSTVLIGASVSITSATPTNVTSISLTAGDWDVWGNVVAAPGASTVFTQFSAWISTTSATLPTLPNEGGITSWVGSTSLPFAISAGRTRIQVASGTVTVFLSTTMIYTSSTPNAYGFVGARRVR